MSEEKIQGIQQISQLLQKKYKTYTENVVSNLDFIERQLEQAKEDFQKEKNQNEILENISQKLLDQKPLTQIETNNRKIYKYISKLGKKIDALKTFKENFNTLDTSNFDHKSLKEAIAEYILYYSILEQEEIDVDQICSELGLINKTQVEEKLKNLQQVRIIEQDLNDKKIEKLLAWVFRYQEQMTTMNSDLPFLTFKMQILLERKQGKPFIQILELAKSLFANLQNQNKKISIFLTSLFINKENIQKYYKQETDVSKDSFICQVQQRYEMELFEDWSELKKSFLKNVHQIHDISPENPLFQVFQAGLQNYSQFCQHSENMQDFYKQDQLNFALDLDDKFNYHNLIICPVNKEICTKENPPVLLNCGHVISDSSAKKLAKMNQSERNNNFKCPICPSVQNYGNVRILKIN